MNLSLLSLSQKKNFISIPNFNKPSEPMPFKAKLYSTPSQLASPSFFPNVLQPQCRQLTWQQVAHSIASDASLQALTERIRNRQEGRQAYSQAKRRLQAISSAGSLSLPPSAHPTRRFRLLPSH